MKNLPNTSLTSDPSKLLLTAEETCDRLACSKRQLRELVKRRLLPKHPAFRIYFFRVRDVEAFAAMG